MVRTLCQDVDEEVRVNMCCELPRIAQALGLVIVTVLMLLFILYMYSGVECMDTPPL